MREKAISLLRRLTQAHGVTGYEDEVRKIFREEVSGEILTDKLGSMYARREGSAAKPVIMLAGHLDEVGYVVQSITADGYIKLVMLGGIWSHTLLAQKLRILTDENREVTGVISSKPIHFTTEAERARVIPTEEMFLDIGAKNAEEVRGKYGVQVGQPVVFDTDFVEMGDPDIFMAKAFDNRVGVGLAISIANALMENDHPNTVYCGANSQEEIHGRGAQTAASLVKPDIGIVLEGIPADDLPGTNKDTHQGAMGKGVQIRVMDGSTIINRKLNKFVIGIAEELKIPYQVAVRRSGGTDASLINLYEAGVPVTVLGVPVRYTHTANSMININDYLHCQNLLLEVFKRLDNAVYNHLIAY